MSMFSLALCGAGKKGDGSSADACFVLKRRLAKRFPVPRGVPARLVVRAPATFADPARELAVVFDPSSTEAINYAYAVLRRAASCDL